MFERGPVAKTAGLFAFTMPDWARILSMVFLAGAVMLAATSGRAGEDDERRFAEGLEAYDAGDFETAIEAWRPLAEAGDLEAQVSVAEFYLNGLGVTTDPAAAVAWYRRAAEAGDPVAQLNLGDLYARGLGVAPDPVEAFVWFDLAAQQGKRWAAARRDEMAPRLDSAQHAEAQARIERYRSSD